MNILFVCKHNRFRSKVAEAFFKHYYKGNSVKAKSAGTVLDLMNPYIARNVNRIMRDKSIPMRDDGAVKVDTFILNWANKIIVVGDNVASEMFKDKDVVLWPIGDASENDVEMISRRVDEIEKKVLEFTNSLKE